MDNISLEDIEQINATAIVVGEPGPQRKVYDVSQLTATAAARLYDFIGKNNDGVSISTTRGAMQFRITEIDTGTNAQSLEKLNKIAVEAGIERDWKSTKFSGDEVATLLRHLPPVARIRP